MRRFMMAVFRVDVILYWAAGLVLACMMLVTLSDVIMRNLGRPIVGSLEIISFCGSVVVGFAIPYALGNGSGAGDDSHFALNALRHDNLPLPWNHLPWIPQNRRLIPAKTRIRAPLSPGTEL